ncbi:MAG TPA: ABC transporter permease [Bacteroidia bacterium]|nr:ABC transporter permease [Bacteroidia bacterium]
MEKVMDMAMEQTKIADTAIEANHWTLVIKPVSGWFNLNLNELWNYRDLIFLFVKRDFISLYKQTILGPLWFFIQPLLTTITFTVIFGNIAQLSTDGLPPVLFYLAGITCWTYFSECFNKTSNVFSANASIFGKVYFPRLVLPFSIIISNLFKFGLQFLIFLVFYFYFKINGHAINIGISVLFFPLLIVIMAGLGLGLGIIISSMTTKYRDLQHLIGFGVQLMMYASPIVYPLSSVPDNYKWILLLNPMTSIIEAFKFSFLGVGVFSVAGLIYSFLFMCIALIIGIVIFSKVEKSFMDTV